LTKRGGIVHIGSGSTTLRQYKEIQGAIATPRKHFLTVGDFFLSIIISWSYCDCCQIQLLVLSIMQRGYVEKQHHVRIDMLCCYVTTH